MSYKVKPIPGKQNKVYRGRKIWAGEQDQKVERQNMCCQAPFSPSVIHFPLQNPFLKHLNDSLRPRLLEAHSNITSDYKAVVSR